MCVCACVCDHRVTDVVTCAVGVLCNCAQLASSFGPVAPFDASLFLLVVGGVLIMATWSENYGDNRASST